MHSAVHFGDEQQHINSPPGTTRKLSYRKDDRTMRPIYGCPENFRESLSTPTATFREIFHGLLFRSILLVTKFEVHSFTRS